MKKQIHIEEENDTYFEVPCSGIYEASIAILAGILTNTNALRSDGMIQADEMRDNMAVAHAMATGMFKIHMDWAMCETSTATEQNTARKPK